MRSDGVATVFCMAIGTILVTSMDSATWGSCCDVNAFAGGLGCADSGG